MFSCSTIFTFSFFCFFFCSFFFLSSIYFSLIASFIVSSAIYCSSFYSSSFSSSSSSSSSSSPSHSSSLIIFQSSLTSFPFSLHFFSCKLSSLLPQVSHHPSYLSLPSLTLPLTPLTLLSFIKATNQSIRCVIAIDSLIPQLSQMILMNMSLLTLFRLP